MTADKMTAEDRQTDIQRRQEELFQAEESRSDKEHHQPTAGAMIGHVTSNLVLHMLLIEQARLFARGRAAEFLEKTGPYWEKSEADFLRKLNDSLAAEGDLIPTVTDQFRQFSMVEESAASKYKPGEDQLFDLIKAFDTQLLFITRSVSLADKEGHYGQSIILRDMYGWVKEQIRRGQQFLNHDLRQGLYQEEDDSDTEDD